MISVLHAQSHGLWRKWQEMKLGLCSLSRTSHLQRQVSCGPEAGLSLPLPLLYRCSSVRPLLRGFSFRNHLFPLLLTATPTLRRLPQYDQWACSCHFFRVKLLALGCSMLDLISLFNSENFIESILIIPHSPPHTRSFFLSVGTKPDLGQVSVLLLNCIPPLVF